jgi:hypothetical protein
VILTAVIAAAPALAGVFPDVADDSPYRADIEWLVGEKVINGRGDGRYAPKDFVNRAEFLTLSYRAAHREPAATSPHRFIDVPSDAWFTRVVNDAVQRSYVQGYSSDNTFKPERPVTRTEAMKIALNVLGVHVPELSTYDREIVRFADVSLGSWYIKFLYFAYANAILPLPTQGGNLFYPDQPLLREEAASLIANVLRYLSRKEQQELASSAAAMSSSSATSVRNASSAASAPQVAIETVSLPFQASGVFTGKQLKVYRFPVSMKSTAKIEAHLDTGQGGVTCKLFRIGDQGISYEYYLGYREGLNCWMVVTMEKGDYQLEVNSADGGGNYTVKGSLAKGDSNDGFIQALVLKQTTPRVANLDIGDYMDFYTFTLSAKKNMRLELASAVRLTCTVWPMENVELESFTSPACNTDFDFPPGTYIVGVGHAVSGQSSQTYTLRMK